MFAKTTRVRRFVVSSFPLLAALLPACLAAPSDSVEETAARGRDEIAASGNVHLMPRKPDAPQNAFVTMSAPAGAQLSYYGGPVLSNVKVWTVFWNASVPNQSDLNSFYSTITSSAYFDWLTEYNTPTQTIGHGSLAGSVIDTGAPASQKPSTAPTARTSVRATSTTTRRSRARR